MKRIFLYILVVVTFVSFTAMAKPKTIKGGKRKIKDAVVLVVRHAEKPDSGPGLAPKGERRADAYVDYFADYKIDGEPLHLDHLYAAADTKSSQRSRLTLQPLAKATDMIVDCRFGENDYRQLSAELRARRKEKEVLIAWHHEQIPELIRALGADPEKVLPGGKWPDREFGWVIQLSYDADGQLEECKRIEENIDLDKPPKIAHPRWFRKKQK